MKKALLFIAPVCLALVALFVPDTPESVTAEFTPRDSQMPIGEAEGAQWYYNLLRANPETGVIDQEDVRKARKAVERLQLQRAENRSASALGWIEMGPDNIGGRTRAVWSDSEEEYWVGSVSGGVWHTTNEGNTWTHIPTPSNIISDIARMGDGTLVFGTGNTFESGGGGNGGSGFIGEGAYYSEDDGATWTLIDGTYPGFATSNANWGEINTLRPDPNNDDGIWMGGRMGLVYWDKSSGTLTEGGWDGLDNGTVQDIAMAPDASVMLAAVASGSAPRVFRSTDNGQSWTNVSGNGDTDLPQSGKSRARVSISQTDPDHCFVLYAANNGSMGGVWYSANGGTEWQSVWSDSDELPFDPMGSNTQGYYDLALSIEPDDPTIAYVAGVTLWKCGPNYQPEQIALNFAFPGSPLYVHSDIHEIKFTAGGRMLIGCDGGMHRSDDGVSFVQINRGYNVTQFYSIAHSSGSAVLGGTQDNGSLVILADGTFISDQEAFESTGGDGFDCELNQFTSGDRTLAFTTIYRGQLFRFDQDGGGGMFYDDEIMELMDPLTGEIGTDFFTSIRAFEDTEDDEAEQFIILINPFEETIEDPSDADDDNPVFTLQTLNQDIPFDYELDLNDPDYAPLMYWDSIVRPAFDSNVVITEDSNYWWLDVQALEDSTVTCITDSTLVGTETVIDEIIPIIECEYIEVLDSTLCFEVGADTTYMDIDIYDYSEECSTMYHYAGDILYNVPEHRRIQDRFSTQFAVAFNGTNGLWITREAYNMNTTPNWFKIVDNTGTGVKNLEWSPDGDHLFYSNYGSNLFRIDNLDQLWSEEDIDNTSVSSILSAGGTVTGIAVDPNDKDHVVITVGGYGINSQGKVRESFNATSENPTWNNIWFASSNDLARMPVYDAVIDVTDGTRIVIGTEFGVFVKDGSADWELCNDPTDPSQSTGIGPTPVYDLRQQEYGHKRFTHPDNTGVIYAGTHGRGIFRSEGWGFVNVEEPTEDAFQLANSLNVFPNPSVGQLNLQLELDAVSDVTIDIFSVSGQWVRNINRDNVASGASTMTFDLSDLSNGNYILRLNAGGIVATSQFVIMK